MCFESFYFEGARGTEVGTGLRRGRRVFLQALSRHSPKTSVRGTLSEQCVKNTSPNLRRDLGGNAMKRQVTVVKFSTLNEADAEAEEI